MISRPFLVALYALAQAQHCISAVSNRTIDDVVGDEVSGAVPIYSPPPDNWNVVVHNNCTTCSVKPDPTQAFNQTWHDVTVPVGATYSVILNFTGTAIYFFGIVPNTVPNADTLVNLTFILDGASAGTYTHIPDASNTILYSVPMLSKDGLSNDVHTLVAHAQSSSLLIFDYAMYTFENKSTTPSASSVTTSGGSTVSSISASSGTGVNSLVLTTMTFVAPPPAGTGGDSSFPVTTATHTIAASTSAGAGGENPLPPKTTPDTLASAGAGNNSSFSATMTSHTLTAFTSAGTRLDSPVLTTTTFVALTSAGTGGDSSFPATTATHTVTVSTADAGGKSPLLPTTTPDTLATSTSASTGDESLLLPTTTLETLAASTSAGVGSRSSFPATSASHTRAVSTSANTGVKSRVPATTTPKTLTVPTSAGAGGNSPLTATTPSHTLAASTSAGTGGANPVPPTTTPDTLAAPTSAGTGGDSTVSHNGAITGYTFAGILGLVGIAGLIAIANWASQVIQAKKSSKPGMFPSKVHEFIFLFPPYLPWPKKEKIKSHQITLTLTPVDITERYSYQQVVWQRFNIDDGSSQFTARLDYDRAFGTANIRRGRDEINSVSFCERPLSIGHAKPGRIIPLKGSVWANPLEFIIRKYNRITARNDSHIPVRVVLGSYICGESEGSSTERYEDVEEGNMEEAAERDYLVVSQSTQEVGFQSFVVMDHAIGYAETLSASFDLILRAYKTHGVEVGQILSPSYLRDQAVPLLGEQGIRISKLPKIATWGIIPNESGIELKRDRTARTSRKREAAV